MTTTNKVDIQEVLTAVQKSLEPQGFSVTWEFPGFISVSSEDKTVQIGFGDTLDDANGYSWNAMDNEGRDLDNGSFDDLGSAQLIADEFVNQINEFLICLVCRDTQSLLNAEQKAQYALDGWVGAYFYGQICNECFQLEMTRE